MKKRFAFILAGILFLAISVLMPSCKEEIYTDEEALAAMKEGLKYKNDLAKEILALQLANEIQLINLRSQISKKEMVYSDSLYKVGAITNVTLQIYDITGLTSNMSGFSVTVNQNGVAKTLTTDANGLVIFPNFVTGSASFVAVKTGFVRVTGIMTVPGTGENLQQAVLVPVFPTESNTATISGTLNAQLDLLSPKPELVKDGIVSLSFKDISQLWDNINGNLEVSYGVVGVVFDGGFLQSVKTGADGKYEFKIPKLKNAVDYKLVVSTLKKKQQLLHGDYPMNLDPVKVDSMLTWFGYYAGSTTPVYDHEFYEYQYRESESTTELFTEYKGLNIAIEAPTGAAPTAEADITWAHNDSTVVTWNYTTFSNNSEGEFTNITQAPVFVFEPSDEDKVMVVTPTAGVANITNGKLNSISMTNGGVYKEYGRYWGENIAPTQAEGSVQFKFLEQLSWEDEGGTIKGDTVYQTAIGLASAEVKDGKVNIKFDLTNNAPFTRKGVGYTAKPNVYLTFTTGSDNDTILTQNNLKVNLLTGGGISIDNLVLSKYTTTAGFDDFELTISTYKAGSEWQVENGAQISVDAETTYKVDLLNGLFITNGGLGYKTAPTLQIKNNARKQGSKVDVWPYQTIATAATTIDADGRVISIADPVMLANFQIEIADVSKTMGPTTYEFALDNEIIIPTVDGLIQAYARAMVDKNGTITSVLLYNEDEEDDTPWINSGASLGEPYESGQGYAIVPKVTVTPVGKTTVATPAALQAEISDYGRINNIVIVNGGKGYDVQNYENNPSSLVDIINTDGSSNIVYDIDLGSGYHGDVVNIFDPEYVEF